MVSRSSFKLKGLLALGAAAVLVLCTAYAIRADLPEPTSHAELEKEIETMARVLGDALEENDLGGHLARVVGSSSNQRRSVRSISAIRGEYIPSIGAIFTIPVGFPLTEPRATEEEDEENEGEELDLWERNLRSGSSYETRYGRDVARQLSELQLGQLRGMWIDADGNVQIKLNEEMAKFTVQMEDFEEELAEGLADMAEALAELEVDLEGLDEAQSEAVAEFEHEIEKMEEEMEREVESAENELEEAREELEEAYQQGEIDREQLEAARRSLLRSRAMMLQSTDAVRRRVVRGVRTNVAQATRARSAARAARGAFGVSTARESYDADKIEKLRRVLIETLASYGHRMENLPEEEKIVLVVESGARGGSFLTIGETAYATAWATSFGSSRTRDRRPGNDFELRIQSGSGDGPQVIRIRQGRKTRADRYVITALKGDLMAETSFEQLEAKVSEHMN